MQITRRGFLQALVALPAAVAMPMVDALAKLDPELKVIAPFFNTLTGEIWWFQAKRNVIVKVPGFELFVLPEGGCCCFQLTDFGWIERHRLDKETNA